MERLNKVKWCLLGCLIVVLALVASAVFLPHSLTNAVKWLANNDPARNLRALSEQEANQEHRLIEMTVETIGTSKISHQPVVVLKEKDGERYLPIWIGLLESNAISVALEGVEVPRPLTSDLLLSIIDSMKASVDCIVVNDLQHDIHTRSDQKETTRQPQTQGSHRHKETTGTQNETIDIQTFTCKPTPKYSSRLSPLPLPRGPGLARAGT